MSKTSLPCPKCGKSLTIIDIDTFPVLEPVRFPLIRMDAAPTWQCRRCGYSVFAPAAKLRAAYASAVASGRRRIDWTRDFKPAK